MVHDGAQVGGRASPARAPRRCGTRIARVALTWDSATGPRQSAILVQLYVDGEPRNLRGSGYPFPSAGASWSAQSQDDAYTICRGSSAAVAAGLTEGVHRFESRGRVLGSDAVLGTNAVEAGAALRRGRRRRRRRWREGDGSGEGEGSRRL